MPSKYFCQHRFFSAWRSSCEALAKQDGGFTLRSGLVAAAHLALALALVWGGLFWFSSKSNFSDKFTFAQINFDPPEPPENQNKRSWNAKSWDLATGQTKTEFHSKWIHYLDYDNNWKEINPTLKESSFLYPDYYVDDQLPFTVKIPKSSLGIASFESNNRFDIFNNQKIDEPPLTQTIQALDVQNVSGVLENFEANNQNGSGGPMNSVRYPLAYPQYNADLIYWISNDQAPRLNKLVKFTINPFVQQDVRLRFRMSFDQPIEVEAEEEPLEASLRAERSRENPEHGFSADETSSSTPRNDRKKWTQQAKLKTKKRVSIKYPGSNSRRGIGMKDFYVWDSSETKNRQRIEVEFESVENQPNTFILTKIIPKAYLDTATYPVFTDTVSTFFPDANPETTTVDGTVGRDVADETFSALRGGAGTYASNTGSVNSRVTAIRSGVTADTYNWMARGIFLFDTSSIPDSNTIYSATLSLYCTNPSPCNTATNQLSQSIGITSANPASNTALVSGDYAVANFGSTDLTNRITIGSWALNSYNNFILNSSGLSNISKTGVSKFGVRVSSDIDNTAPTWSASQQGSIDINQADSVAGTSQDPRLVVTHCVTGACAGPKGMMNIFDF